MPDKKLKLDAVLSQAVDQARQAAVESTADATTVGEYLGCEAEAERVVTHWFACTHRGYQGWRWSVTMARASRAKQGTVNEVVLLPGTQAALAPDWVPWAERIAPGDVQPGVILPTADDDPRLEPGFTGGERAADLDPAEASQMRAVVAELGLGRERVLSADGRAETAERWLRSDGGPDNPMTHQAPAQCASCGYFVRLQGQLGTLFGACCNVYSPSDRAVVSFNHGCGGHSDVAVEHTDRATPIWDTVELDAEALFD